MGKMKEIYGRKLEQITGVMDQITYEYNEILSLYDYWDHLQDFYEMDELSEFEAGILDHYEFLQWTAENIKEYEALITAENIKEYEALIKEQAKTI